MDNKKYNKLVDDLITYAIAYYEDDTSLIDDGTYDRLYKNAVDYESQHPEYIRSDSPTQHVGYSRRVQHLFHGKIGEIYKLPYAVYPFVKWLGGKSNLADDIIPYLPKDFNNYYEPFVGGCGFVFRLINLGIININRHVVTISDNNPDLINLYITVRDDLTNLITLLDEHRSKNSKEYYLKIRSLDRDPEKFSSLSATEQAARFLYLNKVCYNGLMRYSKHGYYNTPYGSYKDPKIYNKEILENASKVFKYFTILHTDYKNIIPKVEANDLIYLDPPYYPTSDTSNFTNYVKDGYTEQDQIELARQFKILKDRKAHVVESNSNTDFIRQLYKKYKIVELEAKRYINRSKTIELLII